MRDVVALAMAVVVALAVVGIPFVGLAVPEAVQPRFQAWAIVWSLLALPAAGIYFGVAVDRRAEFSERALQSDKLSASEFARVVELHHGAKRQLLVLSAIAAGIPAGLFMALIFPATELVELKTAFGQSDLSINTKNAGFAVMAVSLFGLWLVGLAGAILSPVQRIFAPR